MDRAQLADFLRRRREVLQPEDVGIKITDDQHHRRDDDVHGRVARAESDFFEHGQFVSLHEMRGRCVGADDWG